MNDIVRAIAILYFGMVLLAAMAYMVVHHGIVGLVIILATIAIVYQIAQDR